MPISKEERNLIVRICHRFFPWTQQKLKRRELNRVPVENCFGKKRKISQVDSQDVAEKEEPVARCHGEREETRTTTCEATATENVSQADQESPNGTEC